MVMLKSDHPRDYQTSAKFYRNSALTFDDILPKTT